MSSPEYRRLPNNTALIEQTGIGTRLKGMTTKIGYGIWDAWHGSARWLYEHGRMQGLIDWEPVFYNQGIPKEVRESVGVVSVSLPFKLDGKHYPATRESGWMRKLLLGDIHQLYDPDFPQMILSYEDPHPEMIGDEVLRLFPTNRAVRVLNLRHGGLVWRMWMPGTETVAIEANGQVIEKEHADMTAGDVVDMLIGAIDTRSQGKIMIYPAHLHAALRMITEVSPRLNERWKILVERLKFSRHLMEDRHRVMINMTQVVYMDGGNISKLLEDIRVGRVQNWGNFMRAIDEVQNGQSNLLIHPGGNPDTAIVLSSGSASAVRDLDDRLRQIPPSLFLSFRGLHYFNTLLDEQKERLDPEQAKLAGAVVDTQVAMVRYQRKFIQARLEAWETASKQISADRSRLLTGVRDTVSAEIDALRAEIEGQITSRPGPIMDIPQIPPISGQSGSFFPPRRTSLPKPGKFRAQRGEKSKSPTERTSMDEADLDEE